jgi:CheY-like chemotaxis protein
MKPVDMWKILVVEDDLDGQEVVASILRHHNISMEVAESAEAAIDKLATHEYSAAIIDLALPGMDGWGLLKAIHRSTLHRRMPCIAMTAYHSSEVAVESIRAGFTAYFPKPVDPTSFVRELSRFI